ncbi:MarR family winged helix-turn-helix transcriptional regulator [Halalkalicoccus ordinarius]|uniref:MarR family winged helix-turn-helix transcriptional regulator n=1 Tax=Halalkalicoccus ordinarius TaxID=3116651 RepID=UPI00300EB0F9
MPPSEQTDAVRDLSPSAKLVYIVLVENGQLTQQGIAEESYLPVRTVRYAGKQLKEIDVIDEEISIHDARQRVYYLTADDREGS